MTRWIGKRGAVLLLVLGVVLAAVPGVAAAATRTGGTVVVGADETVDGLTAFGGTVIVRGTVKGDLRAFAGNVIVEGNVTGDVDATAGNVRIAGRVGGDVSATGGNVFVEREARINGTLEAAAGTIVVGGTVGGNARLAGGSITLESTARIDGNVEYSIGENGEFVNEATVGGTVTGREDLSIGGGTFDLPDIAGWAFGIYGFLVNLLLGALLLLVFPGTSREIAGKVAERPLRSGGIGLLALIGVPIGLVVFMLTVVGIPFSLVGLVLYGISIWVALVYGRFAVGSWLLSLTDWENRWVALLTGLVLLAVLIRIPMIGWVFNLAVLLLGLGAMADVLYRHYRENREAEPPTTDSPSPADAPDPAP